MSEPFRRVLEVEDRGDSTVVKFVDRMIMGEQVISAIGEQLNSLVDQLTRRKLTLDFTGVEYIASHVLGKFVAVYKKLKALDGQLIFCNLGPQIYKTFHISRLDKFFEIQPPKDGADLDE